jgi:hypothetical protein
MATVPVGVGVTLQTVMANIRVRSNSLSQQKTKLLRNQLIDLIHSNVLTIKTLSGRTTDTWYRQTNTLSVAVAGARGGNQIVKYDVSAVNFHHLLGDSVLSVDYTKEIPVFEDVAEFNSIIGLYPVSDLASAMFGVFVNVAVSGNIKLMLQVLYGSNLNSGDVEMTFIRNPVKASVDTDKMDLPDSLIPVLEAITITQIYQKFGQQPPADAFAIAQAFMADKAAMIGLHVTKG